MPLYEVEHVLSLSRSQKDAIAEAITKHHTETFTAPRLFVNVRFTDVSGEDMYVAGVKRNTNRIIANVRGGPSRTREKYDQLLGLIANAWDSIVDNQGAPSIMNINGNKDFTKAKDTQKALHAFFMLASITAGAEAGFLTPAAGEDGKWLEEFLPVFEKRAEGGDEDFVGLVKDVRGRKAFGLS